VQNVLLPPTHWSDYLLSSVCNIMHCGLIHLLPSAYGASWSPLIYSVNRMWSDRRLQHIQCYKMCSNDSGLWCWDATTWVASDYAPSQRRGRRGVLSLFFEVRACQGRVTLLSKSLQGVRESNMMFPPPSTDFDYSRTPSSRRRGCQSASVLVGQDHSESGCLADTSALHKRRCYPPRSPLFAPAGFYIVITNDPRENLLSEAFRLDNIKFYRLILL